jgi:hypothetical protein
MINDDIIADKDGNYKFSKDPGKGLSELMLDSDCIKKMFTEYCGLSSNAKIEFLKLVNNHYIETENPTYNKYKNSIKIWPYLDDVSQAIIPYSNEHLSESVNTVVNLDFSRTQRVSSSGAALALMKLISTFSKRMYLYRTIYPDDQNIERYFQQSGFFSLLDEYFHLAKVGDLFDDAIDIGSSTSPYITFDKNKIIKKTAFPIFRLKYSNTRSRESIEDFIDNLTDIFDEYLAKYNIRHHVLISVINEIAKNSHDHTEADSYFGLDIIENTETKRGELFFSLADLGIGIAANVRNNLPESLKNIRAEAAGKFSFSDSYQFAFTPGNSTSKKPQNKGIGMTIIIDGANSLNLDLTIWDGRSMLIIPETPSHSELRRNIFDTGKLVGFYYYGGLKF